MQLLFVVLGIVSLNVASGVILKTLADQPDLSLLVVGLGVAVVFMLNGLRLVIWMLANRRFPLSTTYPLTSIFFPVMLAVSFAYSEPVSLGRALGTLLITGGVCWLGWRVPKTAQESARGAG